MFKGDLLILLAESTRDVEYSLFLSEKIVALPHLFFEFHHDFAVFSPNVFEHEYSMYIMVCYLKDL